jgi:FixJ family two-component response regulator
LIDKDIAIPIVFISGHGGVPETVQAIKAGAVDFLEKPFRQHVLVDCITAAFATDMAARAKQMVIPTFIKRQCQTECFGALRQTNR